MGSSLVSFALSQISSKDLYESLKKLGFRNDTAVADEYREQMDQLTVELAGRLPGAWEEVDEAEFPTKDDVKNIGKKFCAAHEGASGPPKRKLLVNAFFGYFNPKFFRDGMSKILWDYAVQLEYPDARYLRQLIGDVSKQNHESSYSGDRGTKWSGMQWPGHSIPVRRSELEHEFAQRLERIGLVEITQHGNRIDYVLVSPRRELVEKLMEFLWEDPAGTGALTE